MKTKLGDTAHVNNITTFANLIRPCTRGRGERETWATHTEVCLDEANMIGALGKGVRIANIKEWMKRNPKAQVVITRSTEFNAATSEMERLLLRYDRRKYGYDKIIAHYLDHLIGDRYFFRKILFMQRYPICSWIPASAYWDCFQYKFGVEPDAASPDDIADHCARGIIHHNTWKIISYSSQEAASTFLESVDPLHRI